MKTTYFEYPVPYNEELRELYKTPYRFSKELRDYVDYMFTHPHCRWSKLYENVHHEWDSNDMLKQAYLVAKYFMDNPNQYGGALDNCADTMLVRMWRCFCSLNRNLRNSQFMGYKPTPMKVLTIGKGKFLDLLIKEINSGSIIMDNDDMVKVREGKTLREREPASMKEGSKHFEYLCSLE